jgi:uncharacterized integral membrane protein (TIGR00698 family)
VTIASPAASLRRIGPGLLAAAAIAALARAATLVAPPWLAEAPLAVFAGLAIAAIGVPAAWSPGLSVALKLFLRVGIVLLGAQLSLGLLAEVGGVLVVVIVGLVALALVLGVGLGLVLGIPPRLALLLGVGTAICGNTAIITVSPVVGASGRDTSYAVTTITVLGTAAVLLYPIIGLAAGLAEPAFGVWAGLAVHDTSQVVATASAVGGTALTYATVVKLTRNMMLAPVLLLLGAVSGHAPGRRLRAAVPLFVWGFLALAVLRSIGVVGDDVARIAVDIARALILVALAALGLSTPIRDLPKLGLRPFLLGLVIMLVIGALSFAVVASGALPLPG